jgi:hypothetical protein
MLNTFLKVALKLKIKYILFGFVLAHNMLLGQSFTTYYPNYNAILITQQPTFKWNEFPQAENYILEISQNSNFTTGVISISTSNNEYPYSGILPYADWFWRVKAISGSDTLLSNTSKFSVFNPNLINETALWLSSDNGVNLDINGKISSWQDQSNNGYNFNQTVDSRRPTLVNNSLNGLPGIQFAGNQFLNGGDILDLGMNSRTYFAIAKINGQNMSVFAKAKACYCNDRYALVTDGNNTAFISQQALEYHVYSSGVNTSFCNYLIKQDRQINKTFLYRNNNDLGNNFLTPNYNQNSTYRLLIGGYNNANDDGELLFLNGVINEIIFINTVDSIKIAKVSGYLSEKYAKPMVNLGADTTFITGLCNVNITAPTGYSSYQWNTGATSQTISINNPGNYWVRATDIFGRISFDTILVKRPVYDSILLINQVICDGQSLSLNAFIPSGNYSFVQWSDGSTSPNRVINSAQNLSYTLVDNNGCQRTSNIAAYTIDSSLIHITLGADTNLCSGNTIQLQNTPANITQYDWNTGNTQASQIIDTSGLYMLEVTNSNNCSNRDTIQVNVIGTSPTLNYSFPSSICQFSEGQFNDSSEVPNGNGTINNKTWSISEGSNFSGSSGTFALDTAGTFNVTLLVETEEGCSSSATFPLTVHPKPILSFTTQNYCPYEAVEFTPTNSALAILSSQFWQFGDNNTSNSPNPTHVFGSTGTYNVSLQAEDINGCRDTVMQAVYIQPAPVAAFSFNNTCEETAVNFVNNSNIADTFNITTNTWSYGDGTQAINPSIQKIYADADTFDVQLIVTANNGCQDTSMQSIIIYPRPTLGWQVGPACKNTWTTFENLSSVSVGSIAQTDWLVNLQYPLEGTSSAYKFVTTGVQYLNLTSTSDQGCTTDTLIIVNVQPEINAAYSVSPTTVVAGAPVVFTNNSLGGNSYEWNLGNGNIIQTTVAEPVEEMGFASSFIGDSVLTYLAIQNAIGCKDTAYQYVKVNEPRIDLAINQLFVQDINGFYKVGVELRNLGFVEITQTDLLLKLYNSSPILETETESLAPGESRIYLFNANPSAFVSTQDNEISYLCVEATSYNDYQLIETELSNNISCLNTEGGNFVLLPVYPNPTNDDITYSLIVSQESTFTTSLTDETGRIVQSSTELFASGLHTPTLSMRNLRAGVYYFQISDGVTSKTVKVLKN